MLEIKTNESEASAKIIVVGVGGAGNNAVNRMIDENIGGVEFIGINTDRQALTLCKAPTAIQIGEKLTKGLGAGAKPEVGEKAAEESAEELTQAIKGADMVFVTCGMGGGTGTGASPVIAGVARSLGILTVGIVSIPFAWEAEFKIRQALDGVEDLRKNVDALLVINNENLRKVYPDLTWLNGFKKADETVAAKSIAELITVKGYINLDFADVRRTLENGGVAVMSSGFGEGEHRITKAIEDALHSPLLAADNLYKAKRILINLYLSSSADDQVVMDEFKELNEFMARFDGVKTISGITIDDTLEGKVKVTILASDFGDGVMDMGNAYPGDKEYVILTVAQMDDNAVLEKIDRTPAYDRPGDFSKQLLRHIPGETNAEDVNYNGNGVILFDKTE